MNWHLKFIKFIYTIDDIFVNIIKKIKTSTNTCYFRCPWCQFFKWNWYLKFAKFKTIFLLKAFYFEISTMHKLLLVLKHSILRKFKPLLFVLETLCSKPLREISYWFLKYCKFCLFSITLTSFLVFFFF